MTNSPSSFREDEIIFNPMQEVRAPGSLSQLEWVDSPGVACFQ